MMPAMRGAFALVAVLLLLVACTSEDGGFGNPPPPPVASPLPPAEMAPGQGTQLVPVTAAGGFRFEPEALRIRAGRTTEFELSNVDDQEHTFVISELAVVMLAGAGQTVSSKVSIDPANAGRFAFFCSIGGHRASGMEGTIVVGSG
jgi:plastocyanin